MRRSGWSLRLKVGYLAISLFGLMFVWGAALATATTATTNSVGVGPVYSTQTVGSTFTVTVYANTNVPLAGASAGLSFDRSRLGLTNIGQNAAIASDVVYAGWPGNAAVMAEFVAQANYKGEVPVIAWKYPAGSSGQYGEAAPAGVETIFTATFQVLACGSTRLDPATAPGGLIDGTGHGQSSSTSQPYGSPLSIDAVASAFVIDPCLSQCSPAAATPSATATASPTPTSTATPGLTDTTGPSPVETLDPCFDPCASLSPSPQTPSPSPTQSGSPPGTAPPFSCPSAAPTPSIGSPTPRPTASTSNWLEVVVPPPAAGAIGQGTVFDVSIVSHHSIPVSGVEVTLTFDQTKLQVKSVSWGSQWQSAGVKQLPDIGAANTSGSLMDASASLMPSQAIPHPGYAPGYETFLVVSMQAVSTNCGPADFELPVGGADGAYMASGVDDHLLYGTSVTDVSSVGNGINISCSAGPSFLKTASPSPSPTHTPTPTPTPTHAPTYHQSSGGGGGGGVQAPAVTAADTSAVEAASNEPSVAPDPDVAFTPTPKASLPAAPSKQRGGSDQPTFALLSAFAGCAWAAAIWVVGRFGSETFRL